MKILFYILSLIIPLAGFIIGIIYYSKQDPESKHVGKICIVLAVVGILVTVGLAAVMYVMVLGFGGVDGNAPVAILSRSTVANGVRFTFVSVSSSVSWQDVRITLSDGLEYASWSPHASDLDSGSSSQSQLPAESLGAMTVTCTVSDVAGNGRVNGGDYFTLTTSGSPMFSPSTTYTVTILHAPTGESMTCSLFEG
jgi:FlaG/FlaF family flagellin (archaellin)